MASSTEVTPTIGIPLSVYEPLQGKYRRSLLYFKAESSELEGIWIDAMREAQNLRKRLPHTSELFLGRRYLERTNRYSDFLIGGEWTGTVLDYDDEEILEGITVKIYSDIADVKTRLTKRDGFHLPPESRYVKDFPDKYMKSIAHLWGVKDPKRELADCTYLLVEPGFRPVVCGGGPTYDCRFNIYAHYSAHRSEHTWRFVSETKPAQISKQDYEALVRKLKKLGENGKEVLEMLSRAIIIE